jgi:hypothetical protein
MPTWRFLDNIIWQRNIVNTRNKYEYVGRYMNPAVFFFHPIVGVEVLILSALYLLVTDHGSAVWILRFTRVVRSQSTVQGLLQGEIKKKTPNCIMSFIKNFGWVFRTWPYPALSADQRTKRHSPQVKTWDDARIGNIFSNARNGNARNGTNSLTALHSPFITNRRISLVLVHNGHKLDIRYKKFMIHAVDIYSTINC